MEALVALPETWLGEARASQASVRLWAGPERLFSARLRELSPQADATTRTYAARFTIDNPDETVALGMTATVTLSHSAAASFAKLPLAAIVNRGAGASVFVVEKSSELALRPVAVASFTGEVALVSSGVTDGERVVTLGVQKLNPGEKVRAVEQP
jgi:RND family efflux transporter MFP subunit